VENRLIDSRAFAALIATNEAILRARSQDELLHRVCEAAVDGGGFRTAGALLPEADGSLRFVAMVGERNTSVPLSEIKISVDIGSEHGQGLAGNAFRSARTCLANDFASDERLRFWREKHSLQGIGAAAAVPILGDGKSIGVLLFYVAQAGTFTEEMVRLVERMAENVSFGLEMFARELQKERLTQMFAALSATNEAIMRAQTRAELFDLVCDAAVMGGKFTTVTVALHEPGETFLRIVSCSGPNRHRVIGTQFSIDPNHPAGKGMTGTAFRTRQTCIQNDFQTNANSLYWRKEATDTASGCGLPLIKNGEVVGVLLFLSKEPGAFIPELVQLLERLAQNIVFALSNFDRAEAKREADHRIQYLATHDALTGLPNRSMFSHLLDRTMTLARRNSGKCAILFTDLDRFKVINDSLGHGAGDALLVEVASRLRRCVRESDTVARLGGDEFVVILEDINERNDAAIVANKILHAVSPAMSLGGHECRTTASIGIAVFPDDGENEDTLTKNADIAMYLAKEEGKNSFRFYSTDIKTQSVDRLMLETNLRHALERGQLSLQYQPKLQIRTGTFNGVEALLRWTHPDLGNIPPLKFIPVAEETGLIVSIGRWVIRTACEQGMTWAHEGLPDMSIAVNISPRQFMDENLLSDIDDALQLTGLPPQRLQLEITESMVMQNVSRAIKVLDAIRMRGIRIAIDDFGTGYSSMSLMKQFPIDTIKIDKSFVKELATSSEDRAIATAIIDMGRALGMTVVAEGVETEAQDHFLRDQYCDELQGYLFSRPVSAGEIARLLKEHPAPPLQPGVADLNAANPRSLKLWRDEDT
jgi:diguanylate cyclase (GGDEF)-like protein